MIDCTFYHFLASLNVLQHLCTEATTDVGVRMTDTDFVANAVVICAFGGDLMDAISITLNDLTQYEF